MGVFVENLSSKEHVFDKVEFCLTAWNKGEHAQVGQSLIVAALLKPT